MRSSCHIQLHEKDEIISDPEKVANIMNNNFVNVAESIGRPVDRTTLQMNKEDFIKTSIDKHSHHPSVKLINEHPEHQCKFEFKHVSPKEVETILGKLNTKKAIGCDELPPKLIKAAASAISAPLSNIVNNCFDQCKFPTKAKFAEVGPIHKKNSQLEFFLL